MGSDAKVLVDFEKVTVDTYSIFNGGKELPLVPAHIRNMLRDFTLGDLRDFLSIFGDLETPTSSAFHRILESYRLAFKNMQHEKILAAEHVKKRDATTIHKLDAGREISEYICEHGKFALDQATSGRHMHGVWQDRFPHAHDEGHGPDPGSRWHHLESPAH